VDAPGGGGKTPVMPDYLISSTTERVILRNYEGVITSYAEPKHRDEIACACDYCTGKKEYRFEGVAALSEGKSLSIEPANLARHRRNSK
jgi:lysine 2,3-aminomutase